MNDQKHESKSRPASLTDPVTQDPEIDVAASSGAAEEISNSYLQNLRARKRFQATYRDFSLSEVKTVVFPLGFLACCVLLLSLMANLLPMYHKGIHISDSSIYGWTISLVCGIVLLSCLLIAARAVYAENANTTQVVECPACNARIPSDESWYCRCCETAISMNEKSQPAKKASYFLAGCPSCNYATPAIECPRCMHHIVLIRDTEFEPEQVAHLVNTSRFTNQKPKSKKQSKQKQATPKQMRERESERVLERLRSLTHSLVDKDRAIDQVISELEEDSSITSETKKWVVEQLEKKRQEEFGL